MKSIVMLIAVLVGLSGAAPQAGAVPLIRHLVYEFGYNTKVAKEGPGTGKTTIDIYGPTADGGLKITGSDFGGIPYAPEPQTRAKSTRAGA